MKSISYFGKAILFFIIVVSSLLFMNVISLLMILRLRKEDESALPDVYMKEAFC